MDLATGYMHFGYAGMIIFSIIVGMLLWLADILVRKIYGWASAFDRPFYSLFVSADLTTALLTAFAGNVHSVHHRKKPVFAGKKWDRELTCSVFAISSWCTA